MFLNLGSQVLSGAAFLHCTQAPIVVSLVINPDFVTVWLISAHFECLAGRDLQYRTSTVGSRYF